MRRPEELWRLRASQAVSSSFHLPFQRSLDNSLLLFTREENVQSISYGFLIQWLFGLFSQTELGAHTAGNFSDYGDFVAREIILTGCCYLPVFLVAISRNKQATNVCCGGHIIWLNEKCLSHKNQKREGAFIQRGGVDMWVLKRTMTEKATETEPGGLGDLLKTQTALKC